MPRQAIGNMSSVRHNPEECFNSGSEFLHQSTSAEPLYAQECKAETFSGRVATTWQAVEELRAVWQPWTNGLNTDIEHYVQSLKNDKSAVCPYVISDWNAENPLGILAGQIKERKASTTIAMVRVNGPRVSILEILRKGRMGPPSVEVDRLFANQLAQDLQEGRFDLVFFHRLPASSSLYRSVWHLPSKLTRKRIAHVFSYSMLPLIANPGTRPAVFSGKINREARRKTTNLERKFGGEVGLHIFSQVEELNQALADVEKVHEGTWQSAVGS